MPDLEYINPAELTLAGGYTQVIKAGNIIWIAGQTALDYNSNVVGRNDPEAQARLVYANLEEAFRAKEPTDQYAGNRARVSPS